MGEIWIEGSCSSTSGGFHALLHAIIRTYTMQYNLFACFLGNLELGQQAVKLLVELTDRPEKLSPWTSGVTRIKVLHTALCPAVSHLDAAIGIEVP